jgi:hypothetical protein
MRNVVVFLVSLLLALNGIAQSQPRVARLSFFGSSQRADLGNGDTRDFGEATMALLLRSEIADERDAYEYALDMRQTGYQSALQQRPSRTRVYDAWAGMKVASGRFALRAGQMWLSDLGALGSVGGAMAEYRAAQATAAGRWRFGVFGGLEPKPFDVGYLKKVTKGGGWIALDGAGSRRHVLGYVQIRDANLVERSVVTMMNFIPAGQKFFFYQAGEYDLTGPARQGRGGLNYLFANARFTPVRAIELMATYHHGRSIDTRTITEDVLNGRPVDQKSLDGFLFESVGGRLTVELSRNVRVFGGYAQDRTDRDQKGIGRVSAGLWISNLARSGFDLTVSDNRSQQSTGNSDAWYASIGRNVGTRVYVSADYATSLAFVRIIDSGGAVIDTRPRSRRYGFNSVWNLYRSVSLLVSGERFLDDFSTDDRVTFGVVYRF